MAVGLKFPTSLLPIQGIRLATACANIYAKTRTDLTLIEIAEDSNTSEVFTRNLFCAAPVQIAKQNLDANMPLYCLINAGNANAGTGEQGLFNASETCQALANLADCKKNEVLPFSTGVIGEVLPVDKINTTLPELLKNLSADSWLDAAKAIMTTDTIPKAVSNQVSIDGLTITITGIAKGSGMIRPDMATMLAYIATDANISKALTDKILLKAVNRSFNRITVDGDTSTNDSCVLIATGKAKNSCIINEDSAEYALLEEALINTCCELAQAIIRDGEGATKFLTIEVSGGREQEECLAIAYRIAESPLVKTAFTASDPNWGRILAAIGNSGIHDLEISKVNVFLDDVCIVENGERAASYTEERGKKVMLQDEITLQVILDRGECKEKIWTTDLSHQYITINAEYRS
jgi:glutamate N-acetyltransferase/amino-acid N-acetyltransferase